MFPKGEKELISTAAASLGMSLREFVRQSVYEKLERDYHPTSN